MRLEALQGHFQNFNVLQLPIYFFYNQQCGLMPQKQLCVLMPQLTLVVENNSCIILDNQLMQSNIIYNRTARFFVCYKPISEWQNRSVVQKSFASKQQEPLHSTVMLMSGIPTSNTSNIHSSLILAIQVTFRCYFSSLIFFCMSDDNYSWKMSEITYFVFIVWTLGAYLESHQYLRKTTGIIRHLTSLGVYMCQRWFKFIIFSFW